MSGIYLHIPFCRQACSYCDFYFVTRNELIPKYVDALILEIEERLEASQSYKTLYVGGGTPSRISLNYWAKIIQKIESKVDLSEFEECTIEVNPDDVSEEYIEGLFDLGFNRLSMGVQSFDDELLKFMNRAHNSDHAHRCLEIIKLSSFENFTVDLIYGNPGQKTEALSKDIDELLSYDPPHISAYALTIEPRTRLGKLAELGRLEEPDEELVLEHIDLLNSKLLKNDYKRYEVSNFAKNQSKAIHNANYWSHHNYVGLGPGGHGLKWRNDMTGAVRTNNERDLKAYISDPLKSQHVETLSLEQLAEEYMLMRLRTSDGLNLNLLESRYGIVLTPEQLDFIMEMTRAKYMSLDKTTNQLRCTQKGLNLADRITLELIYRR